MATNLNALIRYTAIDRCLRDPERVYDWEGLAKYCEQYLLEKGYEGKRPAKRTIMLDIKNMRSGVLGYEAPILYTKEMGYHYSTPNFSIHNQPLKKGTLNNLMQGVHVIKSFTSDLSIIPIKESMHAIEQAYNLNIDEIQRFYIDQSLNIKGQRWIAPLYEHIREGYASNVTYMDFKGKRSHRIFHAYFLKEFSGRWYVIGRDEGLDKIINLALDRIQSLTKSLKPYIDADIAPILEKYNHVYGVTRYEGTTPVEITFSVSDSLDPYIATKPIHSSQQKTQTGDTNEYTIYVHENYEIIHKLLSYGKDLTVLSPASVKEALQAEIAGMMENYALLNTAD